MFSIKFSNNFSSFFSEFFSSVIASVLLFSSIKYFSKVEELFFGNKAIIL